MRLLYLGLLLAVVPVLGCGGGAAKEPERVPVTGVAKFRGKPMPHTDVYFMPVEQTKGYGAKARTDAEGKFTLKYMRGGDGAPPGKYKVALSRRLTSDGKEAPPDDPPEPGGTLQPPTKNATESLPFQVSSRERTMVTAIVPDKGGTVDIDAK